MINKPGSSNNSGQEQSKIWCRDQDQAVEDRRVSKRFGQNLDYTIKNQGQKW